MKFSGFLFRELPPIASHVLVAALVVSDLTSAIGSPSPSPTGSTDSAVDQLWRADGSFESRTPHKDVGGNPERSPMGISKVKTTETPDSKQAEAAAATPTPETTEDTEELNDWVGLSPDVALLAATRVIPDQVYIQRHDLDGVAVAIFRAEVRTLVARHDFRGRIISDIEWSPDSKFLLFTTTSSSGHQPWHAVAFVFCRNDNSFREVEPAIGTIVSPNFRFEAPDIAIMVVRKSEAPEAEVKVGLAATVDHMPIVK